jgi:TRAP-type C4-dicarboxylate transport system substrate-binding protein
MVFAPIANAETVIKFSNWLPPTHLITTDILQPWADAIAKDTEGRVRIEFIPALGKPAAHFDLVRNGVAGAAYINPSYTTDRFQSAYGVTFPGLAEDSESASVAYWRTFSERFSSLNEYQGTHVLGLWTLGPNHIFTHSKPVQTISDLKGLRLRATGGIVQDMSELIGIVPQFAAVTETYELLSRGVVDGVMFNWDSVISFRLSDNLKHAYVIPGGLFRDAHNVVINQRLYDSLPEGDRAIIDKHSGETLARLAGQVWDRADTKARDKLESLGYKIVTASDADTKAIRGHGQLLLEGWEKRMAAKNFDGAGAIAAFKGHVAEVVKSKP